jgi:HTH-type transcriptional regulator/antitoxin HigA
MSTAVIDERKYGRLLAKVRPRAIATEDEYDEMVALAGRLIAKGEALSPEEGKLLELLGLLVEDYDDRHYPLGENDPVTALKEMMNFRDLKPKDLWPVLGSKGVVSEILNRKRTISKAQVKKLAEFFHVSADLFI